MTRARRRASAAAVAGPWLLAGALLLLAGALFRSHVPPPPTPLEVSVRESPVVSQATVAAEPPPLARSEVPPLDPIAQSAESGPVEGQSPSMTSESLVSADIVELRRRHLSLPVVGVMPERLVPTFHQPRATGEHEALDILAPRGTPVIAVENGRVEKLFTSQRGGLTVYLFDSSESYCYYYAHLDRYEEHLHEGDQLARGNVVGYVGTTGNAPPETPHLHFAIFKLGPERHWWQGTALDPYLVVR